MKYNWIYYAKLARKLAKRINTGYETMKDGTNVSKAVDIQDIHATDALNSQYSKVGSVASVHTWSGGSQEIHTRHADGSEGVFNTNGVCQGTDNAMDLDVEKYIRGNLGESIQRKKTVRLTESQLHGIIRKCVNEALESSFTWANRPLSQIIDACNCIWDKNNWIENDDDPWISDAEGEVYKWAKKVRSEAEELLKRYAQY